MTPPLLLAVPNVSEGRDAETIAAIGQAFAGNGARADASGSESGSRVLAGVRLLDIHSDPDHDRSVFTLAGPQGVIADAMLRGARETVARVEVMREPDHGQHPHVGALDVAPIVYLNESGRGAACAEALLLADRIGTELEVPVFMYGELAGGRTRAQLRSGGVRGLARRMAVRARAEPEPGAAAEPEPGAAAEPEPGTAAEQALSPDFGPPQLHHTAGATLVAAREPLVAFNLNLDASASVQDARAIAARIREGGTEGLPGVRAIGVALAGGAAQVSVNIERPLEVPLAAVIEAVARHAPVASGELVGLAPSAALEGFPADLELPGFDPERHVIEKALRS